MSVCNTVLFQCRCLFRFINLTQTFLLLISNWVCLSAHHEAVSGLCSVTGKRVVEFSEDEENKYNDILIVMELLTNLLSKDFIDFGESGNT